MPLPYRHDADPRAASSPLARIRDASACSVAWVDAKRAEDASVDPAALSRCRLCTRCGQRLYDLTTMTASQAERLIEVFDRRPLDRLYRRRDGSVMVGDCPVGARAKLREAIVGVAIVVLSLVFGASMLGSSRGGGCQVAPTPQGPPPIVHTPP